MKKNREIIIVLVLITFILASCSKKSSDYISITLTTYNQGDTEEMTTSIYSYSIKDKETKKIFDFPFTAQYPLGVFSEEDNSVYFTKRDNLQHDQVFLYNLDEDKEYQLTTDLRAVNQIVPTKETVFFVASATDQVLRLGALNKDSQYISYWGDKDINVETITLNPVTQKIYISGFSYSEDRENIEKQFVSDDNVYSMPLFTIYETDYNFTEAKELFSTNSWIRLLLMNKIDNNLVAVYDKEYNSFEPSESVTINLETSEIKKFRLPKDRIQVDGGGFSSDGKEIYGTFVLDDQRGIYSYEIDSKKYSPIFSSEDGFINNFQIMYQEN